MSEFICDKCGKECKSQRGLGHHKTTMHGGVPSASTLYARARATKVGRPLPRNTGKAPVKADAMFAKIAAATQQLFPNGIPADRVLEIADLQRAMLEVLTR